MASSIFVGLATIDIVYGVDEFPEANTKIEAQSQEIFVGGPATNAAIAFAHLGGKAALVTAIGRNVLAAVVREELEKHKVQIVDLNPEFEGIPVRRRSPSTAMAIGTWFQPTQRAWRFQQRGWTRVSAGRRALFWSMVISCRPARHGLAQRTLWERRSCSMEEAGKREWKSS